MDGTADRKIEGYEASRAVAAAKVFEGSDTGSFDWFKSGTRHTFGDLGVSANIFNFYSIGF